MTTPAQPHAIFDGPLDYIGVDLEDIGSPVWDAVSTLSDASEDDDSMSFEVIQAGAINPTLPMVLWIHPGDACESDADDDDVIEMSQALQSGMAHDMRQMGDCDVVVLHRYSSQFAFERSNRTEQMYHQAMGEALTDARVTHLFGDDLDSASAWMLENLALQGRPDVLLTGAWSDPDHGCVSAVGKILHSAGIHPLRVSECCPSEPGSNSNVWQPPASTLSPSVKRPKVR